MPSEAKRKLAAIMFTDIVGFSHIMSLDEKKGMSILEMHDEIINPVIIKNSGNILKRMGDAIFAEFTSSVHAVRCAIEIQTALKDYNSDKSPDDMIIIRIGIHLGDVIVRGDDLFGEGINVASRLESLAAPGGICLSQAVYQSAQSRLNISAILVGETELKNIIEKYVVYKIPPFYAEDIAETSVSARTGEKQLFDFKINSIVRMPPPKRPFSHALAKVFVNILLGGGFGLFMGSLFFSNQGLAPGDIHDPEGLILKLRDIDNPIAQQIRDMLPLKTQQLVSEYEDLSPLSWHLKSSLQKNLQQIIKRDNILFDDQKLEYLNLSKEMSSMVDLKPRDDDLVSLNRMLLVQAFPDEIRSKQTPFFISIIVLTKYFMYDEQYSIYFTLFIIIFIISVLFTAYLITFATAQIKFSDVRHTDELLEYFVLNMGFKKPIKEHGDLVFKPTLSKYIRDILVTGFPTKISARIEGNSIIITSTLPTVRRLTKQLKAFSS